MFFLLLIQLSIYPGATKAQERKIQLAPPALEAKEAGSASRLLQKTPDQLREFASEGKASGFCINETGQALSASDPGYTSCTRLQKIRDVKPEKTGGSLGISLGR